MAVTDTRPAPAAHHSRGERRPDVRSARAGSVRADPAAGVKTLFAVLALVGLAYAGSLVVRGPNGVSPTWLDGWGVAAFELVASLLVLVRACVSPRDRPYALWLGLGSVCWALGDFALTYESLGGATPATLSLANWLWAGFFPLAYVGVMVLMERDVRKLTAANYLDGVIATLVTSAALVAFAFHTIATAAGGGNEAVAINLVYPVGDLLLFGLTLFGVRLLPVGQRMRWWFIAVAGLVNAAGDIAALFGGIAATDIGWFLNAMAWPVSLLLISASVWLAPDPVAPAQENRSSGFAVPTAASALALLILFVGSLNHTTQIAIGLASATLVAAGVRFGLALRRMTALTEERHRELEHSAETERASKETLQSAVRDYTAFAARVADGDLTATVSADGTPELAELADSLNTMVSGLAEISREIQAGVHEIGESTGEILSAVSRHTDSAGEQSAAISQTSATVNELRAAADDTARRARQVAQQAGDSVVVSNEGTEAVAALAEAMEEIRARVDAIAAEILALSERTQQIGAITATVNELADQSNLLALNASIEAARAGEHGKGFAVVAEQVRRLSDQSKAATAQVETILNDVREATTAAVAASDHGTKVVDHGLSLTGRTGEGIRSLADTIREASAAAEQIAASAHQQSVGMDQIAEAMTNIDNGTDQFLEGAHQSQRVAGDLSELSDKLAALTDRYRV
ncbi:MAG TPA: methyl-accepting chemotaxis protein [Solirubrobacteraceae bacterium]|jgi:methyl-accepting chemotaxis protein|nr:methyl-accepting chemotaxis protein [Solirubrobacteraceae bacterium]